MAIIRKMEVPRAADDERRHARDLPALIAALSDPDATTRRWAARDIGGEPGADALLVHRLPSEVVVSVREVMISTLLRLGGGVVARGLAECLRSDDVALRNEAIEALRQLPDDVAMIIPALLTDSNPAIRIYSVTILAFLPHPDVEQWLIEVLERDAHVNVCGTALDVLGELGTAASRDAVLEVKRRFADESYIQFAADVVLNRLG